MISGQSRAMPRDATAVGVSMKRYQCRGFYEKRPTRWRYRWDTEWNATETSMTYRCQCRGLHEEVPMKYRHRWDTDEIPIPNENRYDITRCDWDTDTIMISWDATEVPIHPSLVQITSTSYWWSNNANFATLRRSSSLSFPIIQDLQHYNVMIPQCRPCNTRYIWTQRRIAQQMWRPLQSTYASCSSICSHE